MGKTKLAYPLFFSLDFAQRGTFIIRGFIFLVALPYFRYSRLCVYTHIYIYSQRLKSVLFETFRTRPTLPSHRHTTCITLTTNTGTRTLGRIGFFFFRFFAILPQTAANNRTRVRIFRNIVRARESEGFFIFLFAHDFFPSHLFAYDIIYRFSLSSR